MNFMKSLAQFLLALSITRIAFILIPFIRTASIDQILALIIVMLAMFIVVNRVISIAEKLKESNHD